MDKVNEVLAKETLYEEDINFLMQNVNMLPMAAKVRLGLVPAPAIKAVEVPVKEVLVSKEVLENGLVGQLEEITTESLPKKRVGKKVTK